MSDVTEPTREPNNGARQPMKKPIPASLKQPNAQNTYHVTHKDLPLHCPMAGMSLWNSHPRVFLPIEETGEARCPYCSAEYILDD